MHKKQLFDRIHDVISTKFQMGLVASHPSAPVWVKGLLMQN